MILGDIDLNSAACRGAGLAVLYFLRWVVVTWVDTYKHEWSCV